MVSVLHTMVSVALLVGQPAPVTVTGAIDSKGALTLSYQSHGEPTFTGLVSLRVFGRDDREFFHATSSQRLLTSSGEATERFALGHLPDGDYRARLVAAFLLGPSNQRHAVTTEYYLQVSHGAVLLAGDGDWLRRGQPSEVVKTIHSTDNLASGPVSPIALAATISGSVTGHVEFFQNQGGWCPITANCIGNTYLQSEVASFQPFRDAKVIVINATTGAQIGESITDGNGNYFATWVTTGASPASVNVVAISAHKDNRFTVTTEDGSLYGVSAGTGAQAAGANVTTSMPTIQIGSAVSPHRYANVFDGARRAWNKLATSNRMLAYFTNIQIRLLSTPDSSCPTSCTFAGSKLIKLDPAAAFTPEPRVMHEMGHVVSYLASRDQNFRATNDYCYPNAGFGCRWSLAEQEWGSSQFEEGFATFVGDTALFQPNAANPMACNFSTMQCGGPSLELSQVCDIGSSRMPLSVMRYLWDVYDSSEDVPGERQSRPLFEFIDTINAFDNGVENRQKDEAWFWFWVDDLDGRSAVDLRENWKIWGQDTTLAWGVNCTPVGD